MTSITSPDDAFRVPLDSPGSQSHSLIEAASLADDRGFSDHHPGPVVDEAAPTDDRPRMQVDSGPGMGDLREHPREQRYAGLVHFMSETMDDQGVEPRVAQNRLVWMPDRRIPFEPGHGITGQQAANRRNRIQQPLDGRAGSGRRLSLQNFSFLRV